MILHARKHEKLMEDTFRVILAMLCSRAGFQIPAAHAFYLEVLTQEVDDDQNNFKLLCQSW